MTKANNIVAQVYNEQAFAAALKVAEIRANCTFFDQHIVENEDGTFTSIDEGDYGTLPQHMVERIVHTVGGKLSDEDEVEYGYGFIAPDFDEYDADVPY